MQEQLQRAERSGHLGQFLSVLAAIAVGVGLLGWQARGYREEDRREIAAIQLELTSLRTAQANLKESFEYRLRPMDQKLAELTAFKDGELERRQRQEGRETLRKELCQAGKLPAGECLGVLSDGELKALRGTR